MIKTFQDVRDYLHETGIQAVLCGNGNKIEEVRVDMSGPVASIFAGELEAKLQPLFRTYVDSNNGFVGVLRKHEDLPLNMAIKKLDDLELVSKEGSFASGLVNKEEVKSLLINLEKDILKFIK